MSRMANAGAELVTTFALACELQADWKSPTANDMLAPFIENLSEYGFVLQNFWNNSKRTRGREMYVSWRIACAGSWPWRPDSRLV